MDILQQTTKSTNTARYLSTYSPKSFTSFVPGTPSSLTFQNLTWVAVFSRPWRVSGSTEISQFQVANCQSYDWCLIQLACDGRRQRQHFGQFIELVVLLAASRSGRVPWLLLSQFQDAVIIWPEGRVINKVRRIRKIILARIMKGGWGGRHVGTRINVAAYCHKLQRTREGMGKGDVKHIAMWLT